MEEIVTLFSTVVSIRLICTHPNLENLQPHSPHPTFSLSPLQSHPWHARFINLSTIPTFIYSLYITKPPQTALFCPFPHLISTLILWQILFLLLYIVTSHISFQMHQHDFQFLKFVTQVSLQTWQLAQYPCTFLSLLPLTSFILFHKALNAPLTFSPFLTPRLTSSFFYYSQHLYLSISSFSIIFLESANSTVLSAFKSWFIIYSCLLCSSFTPLCIICIHFLLISSTFSIVHSSSHFFFPSFSHQAH